MEADINGDYVLIDNSAGGEYSNRIDDNQNFPTLTSYVSYDTLSYWASLEKDQRPFISNMGKTTEKTDGKVELVNYSDVYSNDCVDFNNGEGVYCSPQMGEGDSGGPTFYESNGDAYLINCTSYYYLGTTTKKCDNDGKTVELTIGEKSAGTGAYSIVNETTSVIGTGGVPL